MIWEAQSGERGWKLFEKVFEVFDSSLRVTGRHIAFLLLCTKHHQSVQHPRQQEL